MKLTDIQNNELINNLSDAKIHSIYFNFDADNPIQPQDLVISVSKLNADLERQQLVFHNTSSFNVKIQAGEQSINPLCYSGDSLYIQSILCEEKTEKHQHWEIILIDNGGNIDIFAEKLFIQKLD
jgi:hypothetical protein